MNIASRIWTIIRHGTYIPIGYYVFNEKRAVYMPVPKTACTSIKLSTMPDLAETNDDYMNIHSDAEQHYQLTLKHQQKRFYKFAFVRNPFDRLVSCYEDKVKTPIQHHGHYYFDSPYNTLVKTLSGSKFSEEMSFVDFLSLVSKIPDFFSDAHFRSQYSILYKHNRLIPNYVGKFEQLSDDWKPIADRFGFPSLELKNRSRRNNLLHYFSTPESLKLAAIRYKRDIEYFDYTELHNDLKRSVSG